MIDLWVSYVAKLVMALAAQVRYLPATAFR